MTAAFDPAAIAASLSNEVIRVAVHDEPLRDKDTASFPFAVLTQELAPFELTEEIVEGGKSVILFETSLRGQRAHGLNVVTYQPDELVVELTVFRRPLAAMQLVAEVIGGDMAQRFGTPPPRECSEIGAHPDHRCHRADRPAVLRDDRGLVHHLVHRPHPRGDVRLRRGVHPLEYPGNAYALTLVTDRYPWIPASRHKRRSRSRRCGHFGRC